MPEPSPRVKAVVVSPAFLVGAAMLVAWFVAAVTAVGRDCSEGCEQLVQVGKEYFVLVGVLPGAFLVAGLLAPPHPFLTGLMLGLLHAALLWLFWLTDWPEGQTGFMSTTVAPAPVAALLAVSLGAVGIGVAVTGVVGHLSGPLYRLVRRAVSS